MDGWGVEQEIIGCCHKCSKCDLWSALQL